MCIQEITEEVERKETTIWNTKAKEHTGNNIFYVSQRTEITTSGTKATFLAFANQGSDTMSEFFLVGLAFRATISCTQSVK